MRQPADRRFGAAREHHVGIAKPDQPRGIADGVRAGGAGRDHGMVRAFEPMLDRHIAGGEIDQAAWNEERAHPPRALLGEEQRSLLDALQAADARADQDAGADLIFIGGRLPAGIGQGLRRRGHRIDNKVVDLPLLFRLHPIVRIVAAVEPSPRGIWQATWQERSETSKFSTRLAALWPGEQPFPCGLDAAAKRRNHPQDR